MAMHSISDLTTYARDSTGDVPPALVGASSTVIGNKMYLYAGRLGALRKMTSDLYSFDLATYVWEKIVPKSEEEEDLVPPARYFHSADNWNGHLVVFGGMGYANPEQDVLCVLADVRLFSLSQQRWLPPYEFDAISPTPSVNSGTSSATNPLIPRARYAHLSSISSNRLYIIGGQDMTNVWLDDIHVFDLEQKKWIEKNEYPRHCGTYRSVAVSGEMTIRTPTAEGAPAKRQKGKFGLSNQSEPSPGAMLPPQAAQTTSDELIHLPYSSPPTIDHPNEIHLYSNYNFTDVKRELEVITPGRESYTIADRSRAMSGPALPPGLRFPTGAILGHYLIIAGTYLAHSYQSFSIWALDLVSMTWSRVDPGAALATGSWSRGVLWASANKFVIFGNRHANLVEDYNRRLLNWDHVAFLELEAFGMYQPPMLRLPIAGQILGLDAFEDEVFCDFEVLCDDGRRIKCSRKLLEERWPWFKAQRIKFINASRQALGNIPRTENDLPMPSSDAPEEDRPDPRLTPRLLRLSEPYPVTKALLQYFSSMALITPLQHAPLVLSALLLVSSIYELPHLAALIKHAMHRSLSPATSVAVYEVATLCDCQNLQIRSLKYVMASSKKNSARGRQDPSDRGPSSRDRDDPGDRDPNGHGPSRARARGMSDAPMRMGAPTPYQDGNGRNGYGSSSAQGQGQGQGGRYRQAPNIITQAADEPRGRVISRDGLDVEYGVPSTSTSPSPYIVVVQREGSVTPQTQPLLPPPQPQDRAQDALAPPRVSRSRSHSAAGLYVEDEVLAIEEYAHYARAPPKDVLGLGALFEEEPRASPPERVRRTGSKDQLRAMQETRQPPSRDEDAGTSSLTNLNGLRSPVDSAKMGFGRMSRNTPPSHISPSIELTVAQEDGGGDEYFSTTLPDQSPLQPIPNIPSSYFPLPPSRPQSRLQRKISFPAPPTSTMPKHRKRSVSDASAFRRPTTGDSTKSSVTAFSTISSATETSVETPHDAYSPLPQYLQPIVEMSHDYGPDPSRGTQIFAPSFDDAHTKPRPAPIPPRPTVSSDDRERGRSSEKDKGGKKVPWHQRLMSPAAAGAITTANDVSMYRKASITQSSTSSSSSSHSLSKPPPPARAADVDLFSLVMAGESSIERSTESESIDPLKSPTRGRSFPWASSSSKEEKIRAKEIARERAERVMAESRMGELRVPKPGKTMPPMAMHYGF